MFLFVAARGFEEQDGDAAGWDVVAAEVGDEALELLEPAGAAVVGVEVYGAAVDAGFGRKICTSDDSARETSVLNWSTEGSVEGFAVQAGSFGKLRHAALRVDDVAEADEEDFVAFFEAGGEVVGGLDWVLKTGEEEVTIGDCRHFYVPSSSAWRERCRGYWACSL